MVKDTKQNAGDSRRKSMKRAIYVFLLLLFASCGYNIHVEEEKECECSIQDGVPNFEARSSYSFRDDPNSIFRKDTLMLFYYIEACGGNWVRELNYENGYYAWYNGEDGTLVDTRTDEDDKLDNCLKLYKWYVNKPKN